MAADAQPVRKRGSSTDPPLKMPKKQCLRQFDDPKQSRENRWDRIVIVEGKKFHVLAAHLAMHSDSFDRMFFGQFIEKDKEEITLSDICADDFQNFLETIHGELCISDDNIEGIMHLADIWRATTAMNRCEHFLLTESKKSAKEKFELSQQYRLDGLKKNTIENIDSFEVLKNLMPTDIISLEEDPQTLRMLFEKAVGLSYSGLGIRPRHWGNDLVFPADPPQYDVICLD